LKFFNDFLIKGNTIMLIKIQPMERILKSFLAVLVLFSTTSLFAQKKWTLEECISYALQNNIQIKREVLQSRKFKKDRTQAYFEFSPTLSGDLYHQITVGSSFSTASGKFENNIQYGNVAVGGSMNLFQGFYNWNNLAKTKYDLLASLEGVEELKRNTTINVTAKYLDVLYAKESYELSKERIITAKKQKESAEKQFELGRISNNDLLQVKAQSINENVMHVNSRNSLELTMLDLAQMLELDTINGFDISVDPIVIPTDSLSIKDDVDSYYKEALTIMPSIKKAKYQIKSADKYYKMAVGSAFPSLTLSYQLSSYYLSSIESSYATQVNDNIHKYLTFELIVPIFGRLQNYTKISKAKIDKLDAQYSLDQTEKTLLKNVQQAYADSRAEYYRYLSMVESEASYREVFEINKEKFDLGMISAVDYGIARNNYIKAQGDLLHAKYSYILKFKILDFYRGIPITL